MENSSKFFYILLITSLILIGLIFISWQVANNLMLINETFALILLTASVIGKWAKKERIQLIIFFFLCIPLFDLLSYSYTIVNGDTTTTYHSAKFNSLINPIVFVLFVVFLVINASAIIKQFRFFFKGSDVEIEEKDKREVAFYYDKFNTSTNEELEQLYKMYKSYPYTAQEALDQIRNEREL